MAACLLGTGGAGRGALGDEGGWESIDSQPLLPPPPHLPALTLVSTATAVNISRSFQSPCPPHAESSVLGQGLQAGYRGPQDSPLCSLCSWVAL